MDQTQSTICCKTPIIKLTRLRAIYLDAQKIKVCLNLLDSSNHKLNNQIKEYDNCIDCQQNLYPRLSQTLKTHKSKTQIPNGLKFKCNESFNLEKIKKIYHEINHNQRKPYQNIISSKESAADKQKQVVGKHRKIVRKVEHSRKCKICKQQFSTVSSKTRHEKIHSGEKSHQCQYCKKEFARACSKNRHERVHTGEKPYNCKYCNQKFAHTSSKVQHERIHTGVNPYSWV